MSCESRLESHRLEIHQIDASLAALENRRPVAALAECDGQSNEADDLRREISHLTTRRAALVDAIPELERLTRVDREASKAEERGKTHAELVKRSADRIQAARRVDDALTRLAALCKEYDASVEAHLATGAKLFGTAARERFAPVDLTGAVLAAGLGHRLGMPKPNNPPSSLESCEKGRLGYV